MKSENLTELSAIDGFDEAIDAAVMTIEYEQQRIELEAEPQLTVLGRRIQRRTSESEHLMLELQKHNEAARVRPLWIRILLGTSIVALLGAGTFLADLALDAFGYGWKAWMLALGAAWVAAMAMDRMLENVRCKRLVIILSIT